MASSPFLDIPRISARVVDVYPYRVFEDGPRWLLLRRSPDVAYAGSWRMVGGKIEAGEAAWQAALRELREETGLDALRAWALPSVNVFYEWEADRISLAPAFAAELDADPALDREHDAFAWLPAAEAVLRLTWSEQRRLLRLADEMLGTGVPPELFLPSG